LPNDLDIVFISAYTQASALAYGLAKLYRRDGTLTILGGPHAKAFPDDCLRFFDVVVRECDKELVADIVRTPPRGSVVTNGRPLREIPSVEERMPEIRASAFWRGRPYPSSTVPLLSSVGCPYGCDFCTDWDKPYALLPTDRLEADLRFVIDEYPNVLMAFHDPNFGVKFDEVLEVLERVPHGSRKRYILESSLSTLRDGRLERLRDVGCLYVAPGVESWGAYSNKAGVGPRVSAREKMERVVEHLRLIHEYVPGIHCNFMFGLDVDRGDEPVELTKEFMVRVPFVWPTINVPVPFGGTPMYERHVKERRILRAMPFLFYYAPYLVTTVRNYGPVRFYEKLVELTEQIVSTGALVRRLKATSGRVRVSLLLRTFSERGILARYRQLLEAMKADRGMRTFHEGASESLPEFYHYVFDRQLGSYAGLVSREDRRPLLTQESRAAR
ncbi:MAG: radical SAM protein, partial [Gemmatimonadetes bacterium]|nr:radical SAM protein [Gemmatimonadota bacterium]